MPQLNHNLSGSAEGEMRSKVLPFQVTLEMNSKSLGMRLAEME